MTAGVDELEQEINSTGKRGWQLYLISSASLLVSGILIVLIIIYWKEIQHAEGLGYTGGFLVGLLGGITVIPAPSIAIVFTLGRVLNPVYIGLVAGLGEAIGAMTIYLTGAGIGSIFSRLRTLGHAPDKIKEGDKSRWFAQSRLARWAGGHGASWLLFISSALVFSPFYFAALAAGSARMDARRFFMVTLAGKLLKGLFVAFAGYLGLYFLR